MTHHRGEEKDALGFGPHRIGTMVSMATDSSHIHVVKMGEHLVSTLRMSKYHIRPKFECQNRIAYVFQQKITEPVCPSF